MELFVLVLNHTELLTDILKDMKAAGFGGATIADCRGMLRELDAGNDDDAPMLGVLRHFNAPERSRCKLVMTTIMTEDRQKLSDIVNRYTGGIDRIDAGIIFCIPLDSIHGLSLRR